MPRHFVLHPPRLVTVGLCYLALTALEILFFHDQMTLIREIGLGLQAGFAAALIYGGIWRSRQRHDPYGFAAPTASNRR